MHEVIIHIPESFVTETAFLQYDHNYHSMVTIGGQIENNKHFTTWKFDMFLTCKDLNYLERKRNNDISVSCKLWTRCFMFNKYKVFLSSLLYNSSG